MNDVNRIEKLIEISFGFPLFFNRRDGQKCFDELGDFAVLFVIHAAHHTER